MKFHADLSYWLNYVLFYHSLVLYSLYLTRFTIDNLSEVTLLILNEGTKDTCSLEISPKYKKIIKINK